MTSISSAQFQELLKSGKIKPGKKGRLAFSGKAGAAIGHLLEQEHTSENDRALKRLKLKKVKIPKKEARQLSEIKMWLKAFKSISRQSSCLPSPADFDLISPFPPA
jgi:hypothetical protein